MLPCVAVIRQSQTQMMISKLDCLLSLSATPRRFAVRNRLEEIGRRDDATGHVASATSAWQAGSVTSDGCGATLQIPPDSRIGLRALVDTRAECFKL